MPAYGVASTGDFKLEYSPIQFPSSMPSDDFLSLDQISNLFPQLENIQLIGT